MTTSDNTSQSITLEQYLQDIADLQHDVNAAYNKGSLTGDKLRQMLEDIASFARRDFPPEQSSSITEASVDELLAGYLSRLAVRKVAAPTGLGRLDTALNGGFQAKRLVTLLGAPGGGKTSLANQWAEKVASERPVLYVTSEDSPDILLAKSLARIGNINYGDVLYGRNEAGIKQAMAMLAERPSSRNLRYLDVSSGMITLDDMRDRAAAHFEGKAGPGLIIVDYLQRMARATRDSAGVKELREAVTQLTERLRSIACELDCCVLTVASMNRQSNYSKVSDENALASAKESGDIEYTADVMMVLTEDNANNKRITATHIEPRILRIAKNRQGPVSSIKLDWRADRQQFTEVASED